MRKIWLIVAFGAPILVIALLGSYFFLAQSETPEHKALEKLRELIPEHEIQVTKERIVIDGLEILREDFWKVVVGKLPETSEEAEEATRSAKEFHEKKRDFINFTRLYEEYQVSSAGYRLGCYVVGIEVSILERLKDVAEVFHMFQEASKATGVGVIGKDIPIVIAESVPVTILGRTDRYRPVFGGV